MNQVYVHYFGILADQRGLADESLQSRAPTVLALYHELAGKFALYRQVEFLRAAVNDEFVEWSCPINDNDRIAFMPPMSGG